MPLTLIGYKGPLRSNEGMVAAGVVAGTTTGAMVGLLPGTAWDVAGGFGGVLGTWPVSGDARRSAKINRVWTRCNPVMGRGFGKLIDHLPCTVREPVAITTRAAQLDNSPEVPFWTVESHIVYRQAPRTEGLLGWIASGASAARAAWPRYPLPR